MLECVWPGCCVRGAHGEWCPGVECEGCRPAVADRGRLCPKHWAWLNRDLSLCAELALQVRSAMVPGPRGDDAPVSGGGAASPAPFDTAAVDAVDELVALLTVVAESVAEQVGVRPPATRTWRAQFRVLGLPSGLSAADASGVVAGLVGWHRKRLEQVAGTDDVIDFGPELHRMVGRMARRWPAAEKPRLLPGTPCRQCDLMDLWWTPPNGEGWPITVECHSCGYVAPEQDLARLTRLVEHEQVARKTRRKANA